MSDVNGHAGQEPVEDGATDSMYIYIYMAYYQWPKGRSPEHMALKYGTNVAPFQDPEILSHARFTSGEKWGYLSIANC